MHILVTIFALFVVINTSVTKANDQVETPNCLEQVLKQNRLTITSEEQSACLSGNAEFALGMTSLCTEDGKDLSEKYKKYLEYEQKVVVAFEKFRAVTDPKSRSLIHLELSTARRNWSDLGYKYEISTALNLLSVGHYHCTQ